MGSPEGILSCVPSDHPHSHSANVELNRVTQFNVHTGVSAPEARVATRSSVPDTKVSHRQSGGVGGGVVSWTTPVLVTSKPPPLAPATALSGGSDSSAVRAVGT